MDLKFDTKAVHSGEEVGRSSRFGDVVAPIHLTSTFARKDLDEVWGGFEYSRGGNPTRAVLEERLASLEGARGALAFSTGMGAETTAALLLHKDSRVVVTNDVYGGTYRLFDKCLTNFGLDFDYVDLTDDAATDSAIAKGADMVWIETPTNPLLKIIDIKRIADAAHDRNPDAIVVVDNTFASPYFQRPLEHGADIVVYSTTKYVSGHSDVLGGALITDSEDLLGRLKLIQRSAGATPGPFDCFLILRGTKTLHLRMERHQRNALAVAQFLERHDMVDRVIYPGLENHPQHELAKRQMSGFSGMVSFYASSKLDVKEFLGATHIFTLAESLGGVESLIEHPWTMTHRFIPEKLRLASGVDDRLVRLSVGIEDPDDLIADLSQAMEKGAR